MDFHSTAASIPVIMALETKKGGHQMKKRFVQMTFIIGFLSLLLSACQSDDASSKNTSNNVSDENTGLFIDLPKVDLANANSSYNEISPQKKMGLANSSTSSTSCSVQRATIPEINSSTVQVYSGARDLNLLFACNENINKWANYGDKPTTDGKKRWRWESILFLEAEKFTDTSLLKGVYIQDMASGEEGETDVRVEYDDTIPGQKRRVVFVDAIEVQVKMRLEMTKFVESGDYYIRAYIENINKKSSGDEYKFTHKLVSYVEVAKDSSGNPSDNVKLAVGKASCSLQSGTPDSPCQTETSNDTLKYWNYLGKDVSPDTTIYNKLSTSGVSHLKSVYKDDDSSFSGYFDIPAQ